MAGAVVAAVSGLLGPIADVMQLAVVFNFVKDLLGTFTGASGGSDALDKLIEFQLVSRMLGSLGGGGGGGIDLGGIFALVLPMIMFVLMFALLPRMLGR